MLSMCTGGREVLQYYCYSRPPIFSSIESSCYYLKIQCNLTEDNLTTEITLAHNMLMVEAQTMPPTDVDTHKEVAFGSVYIGGIKFAGDIGLNEHGEYSAERMSSMQQAFLSIFEQLKQPYPGLVGVSKEPFVVEEDGKLVEKKVTHGASLYRGLLLGDLLATVILGQGKLVTGGGSEGSTGGYVTPSFSDAAGYATKDSYENSVDQISEGVKAKNREARVDAITRFSEILRLVGIPKDKIDEIGGIILSPLVLCFDSEKLRQKRKRGEISKVRYSGSHTEISPYLTIDDLTSSCVEYIKQWSGIDIMQLRQMAQAA